MNRLVFCIAVIFYVMAGSAANSSPVNYDVSQLFSKSELQDILGGPLKDLKVDTSDLSTARYYAVNGMPYLEALILNARAYDPMDYSNCITNARRTGYYKHEIAGVGDKAFWQETATYGTLIAAKGSVLVQITVSQSKAGSSKEEAATTLATLVFERLH